MAEPTIATHIGPLVALSRDFRFLVIIATATDTTTTATIIANGWFTFAVLTNA